MLAQLGETDARPTHVVDQQAARQAEADVPKPDDFQLQLMLEEAGFTKEDLDYINDWQLDPG